MVTWLQKSMSQVVSLMRVLLAIALSSHHSDFVFLSNRQVANQKQNGGEEDDAGAGRPKPQSAIFSRLREQVAEGSAEGTGEDVGHPEGENFV